MSEQRIVIIGSGTKSYRAVFMGLGIKDGETVAFIEKEDQTVTSVDAHAMKFEKWNPALTQSAAPVRQNPCYRGPTGGSTS